MQTRRLGTTGLYVSELCLGTMTFGMGLDEPTSRAIFDRFVELGGTFIDTADVYGRGLSEERVGLFAEGRRQDLVIATKVRGAMGNGPLDRGLSRRHIMDAIDASLRRLRTDYIDLYQTHYWDRFTPIEETMAALDDVVRSGKVRYVGASNVAGWQLAKANLLADARGASRYQSLQPEYSLLNRDVERELVPACLDLGVGIIPYSPLAGGVLTGKYAKDNPHQEGTRGETASRTPMAASWRARFDDRTFAIVDVARSIAEETGKSVSQVALRWINDQPAVTAAIIGASKPAQIDDNLGAAGWSLTPDQTARLGEASAIDLGYPYDFIQRLNAQPPTIATPAAG